MKLTLNFLAFVAVLLATSCSKQNVERPSAPNSIATSSVKFRYSNTGISLDERGNLVFATDGDLNRYDSFLYSATLGEIQDFHQDIGFHSLAGPNYDLVSSDEHIPESDLYKFTFSNRYSLKVGNAFLKLSPDLGTLLTLDVSNYDANSYLQFMNGEYNSNLMNRFIANGPLAQSETDVFQFLSSTTSGYDEFGDTPTPAMRKFWGSTTTYGDCDETGHRTITITYWRFWMRAGTDYGYGQCP